MANSLIVGGLLAGMRVTCVCPEGYRPAADVLMFAHRYGEKFYLLTDPAEGVKDADVVVTAAWNTAPGTPESERRLRDFAGFQVTSRLMEGAKPDAMLLHCLPAHRGEEISTAVFEEHADEIFTEARTASMCRKPCWPSCWPVCKNEKEPRSCRKLQLGFLWFLSGSAAQAVASSDPASALVQDLIELEEEGGGGHGSGDDVTDGLGKEHAEHGVCDHMGQDEDEGNEQDELAQAGQQQADLGLTQRHKALLAGDLDTGGENARHVDAHGPGGVIDQGASEVKMPATAPGTSIISSQKMVV